MKKVLLATLLWILGAQADDSFQPIKVYDNVLSQANAEWLHTVCFDLKQDTLDESLSPNPKDLIFEFPLQNPEKHVPIQRFLNELIWEMTTETDQKYYVEYWTRQEWHHILAHQDMDEGWERELRKLRQECQEDCQHEHDNNFRHPITGQVLYLRIGSRVQGPTVIFDAANGRELTKNSNTSMVSVPAFQGRLLRFPGDRLHAVPRPADVYWTLDQSQNHIHTPDTERSVLLFNLWKHGSLLVDKVLDCGDGIFRANRTTCYKDTPAKNVSPPKTCNPHNEWNEVPIAHRPQPPSTLWSQLLEFLVDSKEAFQVPLSGDAIKRGISGYVARMVSNARENLYEPSMPTRTDIEADERFATGEL